jgi:hypothetical protein
METTTRNASLADLATLLTEQQARKIDVVAPAKKLRSKDGNLVIAGAAPIIEDDGVTDPNGHYRPTSVADEGVADKLGIPLPYVRKMRADRVDLFDANVNGWLRGASKPSGVTLTPEAERIWREEHPGDKRSFLVRCFRGDDGAPGIARAFLSDSYKVIDNLDALTAALDGIRQSGVEINVTGCDLTDRRMYVRVTAPAVQALAPALLERYRSPFSGAAGADNPTVFAGLVLTNSETGGGAFTIVPRLTVQVCSNGMTMTKDAVRAIHLGEKLDEGVIRWSDDTQKKNLDLITAKARDAVSTFLDVEYMERVIRRLEETAGTPVSDAPTVVEAVAKKLSFSKEQTAGVLDHFIKGADLTAGGVMHAVTSFAQTIADADVAADFEAAGVRAMELAAAN